MNTRTLIIVLVLVAGVYLLSATVNNQSAGMNELRLSNAGRAQLLQHEGIKYIPYQDVAGHWTGGVGHLILPEDGISDYTAQIPDTMVANWFETDVAKAEAAVNRHVMRELTQGQFDALVDWTFQYGEGRLTSSSILKYINAGDLQSAVNEFPKWIYATIGGKQQMVPGLVARRDDNITTFLT